MSRINTLRNEILKAKHAYYFRSEPIMSDAEFDAIEEELRSLSPNDPVLTMVGSAVPKDSILTKAKHSMPMGSQNKINSEAEFRNWYAKNNIAAIHASLKGDGASAAAYYDNGRLTQVISRGDGDVGEDITANAMQFKGLPSYVGTERGGFTGSVRFEVILTIADWAIVDPAKSTNPRNLGNGIMGRKNGDQSNLLTAFAFDISEVQGCEWKTESQKTSRLVELGFNVIDGKTIDRADDVVEYFNQIAQSRSKLPYWVDGVVLKIDDVAKQTELGVVSNRPKGQIAWKFDAVGVESVLESVVISGGHTGGLYPTAQFRPVEIGGTTVSNASLANFDEIERLGLAIGDSIIVIKSNEIIPKIIKVTERPATRKPIEVPTCCPFCGGEVGRKQNSGGDDGVILVCKNPECEKKSKGKINRWISSLDILGIGDALLESLIERFDLGDAADLYTLKDRKAELAQLIINTDRELRLGEKRSATILDAIDAKRELTLSDFLGSLGLDYLGKRRVEIMIMAACGELSMIEQWRSGKLRDQNFAAKVGVPGIGTQIQNGIDAMSALIDKLQLNGVKIKEAQLIEVSSGQNKKSVCISGVLPSGKKKAEYKEPLQKAGYILVDDVSKGLDYLVLADANSTSSKSKKAEKLGVKIISENDLAVLCLIL